MDTTTVWLTGDPWKHPHFFAAAFNSGDPEAVEQMYEPDGVLVAQPGVPATGAHRRSANAELMTLGLPIEVVPREVYVNGDLALMVVDWIIAGTAPDGRQVEVRGTATDVARRGGDGLWRYAIDNPWGTHARPSADAETSSKVATHPQTQDAMGDPTAAEGETDMERRLRTHDPVDVPAAAGGYTNSLEVPPGHRLLFISGQIPETPDGVVPDDPEGQCRLIWQHIESCLRAADMRLTDLVKVTTFLGSRDLASVNTAARQDVLEGHTPTLTVIVTDIFSPQWKLEIEAVAAAPARGDS
jgi:enamine deaminase RidA (YjgF/YER057c/UK114 family)/ketosteroid isomerase-like protein